MVYLDRGDYSRSRWKSFADIGDSSRYGLWRISARTRWFIWSVSFVWFIWLNKTNQMNQINETNRINQIDQTNQMNQINQINRLFCSGRSFAIWAVVGLVWLLSLGSLCVSESAAMDIAILQSSDIMAYRDAIAGFKATGPIGAIYTEYDAQGDLELGKKLARKLRASNASLVVAVGLKAALAAKVEIVDVPIVYMMILDPLKHQLTAANMTGTLLEVPVDRQLKIMRTFLPTLHQLGTLYDPAKTSSRVKEAMQQAAISDFQLKGFPVESDKDVSQQLRTLLADVDAIWLIPDSTVLTNESIRFILESALARQIPVIGFSPEFTRLGALLSMSVDYGDVGRETGLLARRILDGERLLPLNPVPSERLKITVNLKTARFLGITFPKELTSLIDETY